MSILTSIKKTIAYAKKYGGNLTEKQLFERLIGSKVYKKEEIRNLVEQTLRSVDTSLDRETFKKEQKAKELANKIAKKFDNILFLGITGSVAADYPKKDDDIDIIIITKVNKLWITRLKLRIFVIINKIPHRKFGKKEKKDEFCFNLWLDEGNLLLPKNRQNLRNSVDLILLKPLINKNKSYEKFIKTNDWAKKYVATGYSLKPSAPRLWGTSLDRVAFLDGVINRLVFWPQFWYMKKRIKNEKISLHQAFFHH